MKGWKDNVGFVLVEPAEWGNVGASARAVKNMGFKSLSLVKPPEEGKPEAFLFAHNALDVLNSAEVYETLDAAVADKSLVVGATRRSGRRRGVILRPEEALARISSVGQKNKVAILFGREKQGLTNDEIEKCGFLITIPTDRRQPSLNLSHAVAIIAYELSKVKGVRSGPRLVSQEQLDALYERLSGALKLLGYVSEGDRDLQRKMMSNLRHLFGRSGLTDYEARMLYGICTNIERHSK